ncbi:SH3 domain-containing protein [Sorangium sp. So ce131]|uniref:SH3 domain-containing protein n=1 Tax=Sorangium sp. So ce131 TaxID=3133282 RepID=UPI003F5F19B0
MDDSPAGQGAFPGPRDARDARDARAGSRPAAPAAPPASAAGAAPAAQAAAPRARRLDRLTGLLLLAAAAVALFPATPVLLRALGLDGAPAPMQSAAKFSRLLAPRPPGQPRPRFDERDDAEPLPSPRAEDPALDSDEEAEAPGAAGRFQLGIAERGITLLDEPRADGSRVGAIAAGELVMIMREAGGWALVAQNDGDNVVMGWARRSEIAIR